MSALVNRSGLWIAVSVMTLLLSMGIFLAACGPAAPAAPTEAAAAAAPTAAAASAEPTAPAAAAEPTAPTASAAVCDPAAITVLGAYGSKDSNPNFLEIAAAVVAGVPAPISTNAGTGPAEFATRQAAGEGFAEQVDRHTIGFYTGHGSRTDLKMLESSPVVIEDLPVLGQGQCNTGDQGRLRYLILSSCNTFAHGPKVACTPVPGATPSPKAYRCPGEWQYDAAGDTEQMASVYTRWGPRLGNGLRMICGSSTDLPPGNAQAIWWNYGHGKSVADAILVSLSNQRDVSLCLAKGGREFAQSPLMDDLSFTPKSNEFDDSANLAEIFYHIQYSKPFLAEYQPVLGVLVNNIQAEKTLAQLQAASTSFPGCLPVMLNEGLSKRSYPYPLGEQPLGEQREKLPHYPNEARALAEGPTEHGYVVNAGEALGKMEIPSRDQRPQFASGIHLMLTSFPADPRLQNQEALWVTQKNTIITFPQLIRLDQVEGIENLDLQKDLDNLLAFYKNLKEEYGQERANLTEKESDDTEWPLVRILFAGSEVQLNPDGRPIFGVNDRQTVGPAVNKEAVRKPDEAFLRSLWSLYYREAYKSLIGGDAMEAGMPAEAVASMFLDDRKEPVERILTILQETYKEGQQPYRLDSWTWGYVHVGSDLLRVLYQFRFDPNTEAGFTAADYPPVYKWVPGQPGDKCG